MVSFNQLSTDRSDRVVSLSPAGGLPLLDLVGLRAPPSIVLGHRPMPSAVD